MNRDVLFDQSNESIIINYLPRFIARKIQKATCQHIGLQPVHGNTSFFKLARADPRHAGNTALYKQQRVTGLTVSQASLQRPAATA
jgi:hypothetical protein